MAKEKKPIGFVTIKPKKRSEGAGKGYDFYYYHMGCHKDERFDNVFTKGWLTYRKKLMEEKSRDPRLFCSRCGEEITGE